MKHFLIVTMLLHTCCSLSAQHTGLIFNEQTYRHLADSCLKAQNRGKIKKERLPKDYSLKAYCPKVGNQFNSSCAAWSVCYSALTIDRSVRQKQTKEETFSAAYVYKQVASSDDSGASVDDVLKFVKDSGTCRNSTFPSNHSFQQQLNECSKAEAPHFKIKGFEAIYQKDSSKSFNINVLKQYLTAKKTIILCLKADTLLAHAFKTPTSLTPNTAHALCVIGYDDRDSRDSTFELFNSWGEDWGDKGYLRVKQRVLLDETRILGAYCLQLDVESVPNEIALFKVGKQSEATMQFNDKLPFLKYRVKKTAFLKEDRFEIRLYALREGQTAYFLTQEQPNQWQVDSVCANEATHQIPFEITQSRDFVYVIFSNTPISDWATYLQALQTAKGQPFEQLQTVFKDLLEDNHAIYYDYRPSVRFRSNKIAIVGFELTAN
jgi:hypothetical protein